MKKHQDRGFTLIELLIVIVILGILAAVTVFAVGSITDDAQTNACSIEKRTIETAAEAYYGTVTNGSYPANFEEMDLSDTATVKARWTYTPGEDGTSYELVGIGKCAT